MRLGPMRESAIGQPGDGESWINCNVIYIGLISYSLYLWHWGVLSISRWTIGIYWWTLPFQIAIILIKTPCNSKFYIEAKARWLLN